jgi:predicted phage terminase large subunit-like protein
LLARRQASQRLAAFIEYVDLGFVPAKHHLLLIEHLEAVEKGEIDRLMVLMPPGSAKSTYASVLFPPWFMGRNPKASLIGASHTTDFAEKLSRRARNVVDLKRYRNVFGFGVSQASQAAGNWETQSGAEFYAAGVGSTIAGRRADLGLIDDPVRSREDADSDHVRQKHWDWYVHDFIPRLKPKARQILIQCMVGSTMVLMADGSEKELRRIRVGDRIATYKNGALSTSTVLNWANQGPDKCFAIRMKSGIVVKANERHPFLVNKGGACEWIRLRDLNVGDRVVRAFGANGAALHAHSRAARLKQKRGAIAIPITTRSDGQPENVPHLPIPNLAVLPICDIAMASTAMNMTHFFSNKTESAPFASSHRQRMSERIGAASSVWTMITSVVGRAAFYAMTVISQSVMQRQKKFFSEPLNIYAITHDEIEEISYADCEDVFDIQVAETENFIANGLVSHNTRWHEDDLGGRILEREGARWTVVKLPMVAVASDPLDRKPGERLWPEWFTEEMVEQAKLDPRAWNALYQQNPIPEEGDYFQRDDFNDYLELPQQIHYYGASDYATQEGAGDYTEHGIFGLDFNSDLYARDWWRGQEKSDVWIERQCDLILQYKPLIWFGESGPIRRAIEPFLRKRMQERGALCRLEWLPSIADKVVRARAIQARCAMGKVFLPKSAPWKADLMSQLMRFPAGKYDDGVDVLSLIGRGLQFINAPKLPQGTNGHAPIARPRGPNAWMKTL